VGRTEVSTIEVKSSEGLRNRVSIIIRILEYLYFVSFHFLLYVFSY
jgi:hypothetical protein